MNKSSVVLDRENRMTTLITDNQSNTLLDHQWINTDQAGEYLKAIKERTDNQLRDFCMYNHLFSIKFYYYTRSIII
jgi:hypothetical protein